MHIYGVVTASACSLTGRNLEPARRLRASGAHHPASAERVRDTASRALLAVLAALLLLCGCSSQRVLISNVTIVTPERMTPIGPTNVLVRDGRIVRIGREAGASGITRRIDGRGQFLVPGLIDGHTHLGALPGMSREHEEAYPEVARAIRRQTPRSYLYHGFTTVIDLASTPRQVAEWNAQPIRPTAHFCGGAPVAGGYPTHWRAPGRYGNWPYSLAAEPESGRGMTPEAAVERMARDGALCVKLYFERGFGPAGALPLPTIALARRVVAAARQRGMPVLLHATSVEAHRFGLEAGVDAFAHGMWGWEGAPAGALSEQVRSRLEGAIANGIATQPTMQVVIAEGDLLDPAYLSRPDLSAVMPDAALRWYATPAAQQFREEILRASGMEHLVREGRWRDRAAALLARVEAATSYLASRGGRLLFGSDTPIGRTFANPPGLNGRLEISNWISAGVSPAQIFRALTIQNAEFFGLDGDIGTIAVGKRADMLLLSANPLVDVSAYDAIEVVIVGGVPLARSALEALDQPREQP